MKDSVKQPESTCGFTAPQEHAPPQSEPATPPPPPRSDDDNARREYDIYQKKIARRAYDIYVNEESPTWPSGPTDPTELTGTPPAPRAGSEPVMKTSADDMPSTMGGEGSTSGGTTPAPPAGGDTTA